MASFTSKFGKKVSPDKAYRDEVQGYLGKNFPEEYEVHQAMGLFEYKFIQLRKEGISKTKALATLEQEAEDEA